MSQENLTYISLFSSAGIGCFGFKEEGFECVATNEILERRMSIQKYNQKCKYDSGYITGDIKEKEIKGQIKHEIMYWSKKEQVNEIDVIIATPPCQGISLANHKKNDNDQARNSLVVESLQIIEHISPKFFVIENVRNFLNTVCTDTDGRNRNIEEVINKYLDKYYKITKIVINFKNYGNPTSRTRTLVIGVRKDLNINPNDLIPNPREEMTLAEVIGHLPPLEQMGEFSKDDFLHNFRSYDPRMLPWIEYLDEGESAFDNKDPFRVPHRIIDGKVVFNKNKNADKYKRQCWTKVGPCIHTRNDILSSQNTIHPSDNRVFSIRELMLLMGIPEHFKWFEEDINELNKLPVEEKRLFLKKHELLVRQSIGDAVPTIIFQQIANKIKLEIRKEGTTRKEKIAIY
ncbi:DNA cytosine methyltransferase [Ornithinibacillus californiensis]|uniref:DNA cytosine methyltransferase n=1 Tax=Ornithinibacillus californiensis TaxID=161536 RepID=UPI00069EC7CF|nr:DNA cytosine methyltransferase [Ornithinibacillus californiensis]